MGEVLLKWKVEFPVVERYIPQIRFVEGATDVDGVPEGDGSDRVAVSRSRAKSYGVRWRRYAPAAFVAADAPSVVFEGDDEHLHFLSLRLVSLLVEWLCLKLTSPRPARDQGLPRRQAA